MLLVLLGCEPFSPPAVVEPGWLYAEGRSGTPSQRCTLEEGTLACTALDAPEHWWHQVTRWTVGGGDHIVTPNYDGGLTLCTSDRTECTLVPVEENWTYATATAGDLDGDGIAELVISGAADYTTGRRKDAYICWGADQLDAVRCTALDIETDRDFGVTLTDIDDDGDRDVVFGALNYDTWDEAPTVCRNNGEGDLSCARWALPDELNRGTTTLFAPTADLNGDGHLDVIPVLYSTHNPALRWCEGAAGVDALDRCNETPIHTVDVPEWFWEEWFPHSPATLVPTDLDQDGDVDLVATTRMGMLYTCANDGSGDFTCAEQHNEEVETGTLSSLRVVDLDGDGEREVFAQGDESIVWCSIDGTDLDCTSLPAGGRIVGLAVQPARIVH